MWARHFCARTAPSRKEIGPRSVDRTFPHNLGWSAEQNCCCACPLCIKAFSETDLTKDLKKFDVPTLISHGDDDQIVPIQASALLSSKIVKGAELKIYKGVMGQGGRGLIVACAI
jgi:pimeloyl-ACP methyl ester carboxylesterase